VTASVTATIATLLAAEGHGTLAADIFVGGLVDGEDVPAAQLAVSRYDGNAILTYGSAEQQPRVQVMVRGGKDDFLGAERRADAVWETLATATQSGPLTLPSVVVDGVEQGPVTVGTIIPIGLPRPLGWDENRRALFAVNAEVTW
jgi:hypothetical protein